MNRIKVEIPGELTDLNTYIKAERTHRNEAAKIKKSETNAVMWICWSQQRGVQVEKPVDVTIHWYVKNKKKDPDNIAFAKKFIMDGMVKAALIPQDSQKYIKSFSDEFFIDKDNPRVEVFLEEVLK